jgi:lysozyme family protein
MNVEELIDDVIGREGGFSNHPADRGGPTRWGVTEAVARAHGYAADMRGFPRSEAVAIYRRLYWQKPGYDRVSLLMPKVAAELFDTGVNMGPATATGFLRRALNALNRNGRDFADIAASGAVDDGLIAALKGFLNKRGSSSEVVLLKAIEALQGERYVRLAEARPANEAFLYGWLASRISTL